MRTGGGDSELPSTSELTDSSQPSGPIGTRQQNPLLLHRKLWGNTLGWQSQDSSLGPSVMSHASAADGGGMSHALEPGELQEGAEGGGYGQRDVEGMRANIGLSTATSPLDFRHPSGHAASFLPLVRGKFRVLKQGLGICCT